MLEIAISINQVAFAKNIFPQLAKIDPYFLFLSVMANSSELIHQTIDNGIDPNSLSKAEGRTPLYYACSRGANESVVALLDNGANPNLINDGKNYILHRAIGSSRLKLETIKLLLDKAENIDIRDQEGRTLLFPAILNGDSQRIDLLIKKILIPIFKIKVVGLLCTIPSNMEKKIA